MRRRKTEHDAKLYLCRQVWASQALSSRTSTTEETIFRQGYGEPFTLRPGSRLLDFWCWSGSCGRRVKWHRGIRRQARIYEEASPKLRSCHTRCHKLVDVRHQSATSNGFSEAVAGRRALVRSPSSIVCNLKANQLQCRSVRYPVPRDSHGATSG